VSNQFFPKAASEVVDANRRATIPWRNWFASVNAALAAGTITDDELTAAVAKILISLGTTDGTADTIVDVANMQINNILPIQVTGSVRDGFLIKLQDGAIPTVPAIGQHMLRRAGPRGRPGRLVKGDKGEPGTSGVTVIMKARPLLRRARPMAASAGGITEAMVMAHVAGSV